MPDYSNFNTISPSDCRQNTNVLTARKCNDVNFDYSQIQLLPVCTIGAQGDTKERILLEEFNTHEVMKQHH